MKKYNYDFIADQEPDGNSEWYPAVEVDKEIERLRKLVKQAYSEGWDDHDDDEMTGEEAFEGSVAQQALKGE